MSEKAKNKGNPRRALLLRFLVGIVVIIGLGSSMIYVVRAQDVQIVFVRTQVSFSEGSESMFADTNSNIWIASLNNPENAQQITFHENELIRSLTLAENAYRAVYHLTESLWMLDIQTEEYEALTPCLCTHLTLHPDGRWLAYTESFYGTEALEIYVYDLDQREGVLIFEMENTGFDFTTTNLFWLNDTTILAFNAASDESGTQMEIVYYDASSSQIIRHETLATPYGEAFAMSHDESYSANGVIPASRDEPRVWDEYSRMLRISGNDGMELIVPQAPYPEDYVLMNTRIDDWFLNPDQVLVSEGWLNPAEMSTYPSYFFINLYDLENGEQRNLSTSNGTYPPSAAQFNHDGSKIVYAAYPSPTSTAYQIMIYDLNKNEEVRLDLVGEMPQWVNGGR